MHDDENDHRSQYIRRYGHALDSATISQLSHAGMTYAMSKASLFPSPTPLQFLIDTLIEMNGRGESSEFLPALVYAGPLYLQEMSRWCGMVSSPETAAENDRLHPSQTSFSDASIGSEWAIVGGQKESSRRNQDIADKMLVQSKLRRISDVLRLSHHLSRNITSIGMVDEGSAETSGPTAGDCFMEQLQRCLSCQPDIAGPSDPSAPYLTLVKKTLKNNFTLEECHQIGSRLTEVCGNIPGARLDSRRLYMIFHRLRDMSDNIIVVPPKDDEEDVLFKKSENSEPIDPIKLLDMLQSHRTSEDIIDQRLSGPNRTIDHSISDIHQTKANFSSTESTIRKHSAMKKKLLEMVSFEDLQSN